MSILFAHLLFFYLSSWNFAGIWVWGEPVELTIDGTKVSVLYLDTEGFESVGKSNVYDDRYELKDVI
jgi:hypothetical protein